MTAPTSTPRQPTAVDAVADAHLDAEVAVEPDRGDLSRRRPEPRASSTTSPPAGTPATAERPRHPGAPGGRRAGRRRTTGSPSAAMRERLGLELERTRPARRPASSTSSPAPLQDIRDVFDLMPTTTEDDWATIADPAGQAVPTALSGTRRRCATRPRAGTSPPRGRSSRIASSRATCTDRRRLLRRPRRRRARRRRPAAGAVRADLDARRRGGAPPPTQQLADFLRADLLAAAPGGGRRGPRALRAARPATSSAPPSTSTRPTSGASRSSPASWPSRGDRRADHARRTSTRRSPPRRRPAPQLHGTEALQRLDAGARRRGRRRAGRTPTSTSPSRSARIECMIAPTNDGGIYYTGPSDDFTRPGRMWWAVPEGVTEFAHLARAHHRLPRGRSRPPPADRADRLPPPSCSTAGAAAVLGLRPRRGLGAVRRAAHGRARLPRRPGRPAGHARRPAMRAARVVSTSACTCELRRARRGRSAATGTTTRRWSSCAPTSTWPRRSLRFELNRYLGWPARPRRTRSASGSGCSCATRWPQREGDAFDLKDFHRRALDLGVGRPRRHARRDPRLNRRRPPHGILFPT